MQFEFQKAMIDEFVKHAVWCHQSKDVTALVFTKHKTELIGLVQHYERKHWAENHRHTGTFLNWKSPNASWGKR